MKPTCLDEQADARNQATRHAAHHHTISTPSRSHSLGRLAHQQHSSSEGRSHSSYELRVSFRSKYSARAVQIIHHPYTSFSFISK